MSNQRPQLLSGFIPGTTGHKMVPDDTLRAVLAVKTGVPVETLGFTVRVDGVFWWDVREVAA
jgi:hypothetical protein